MNYEIKELSLAMIFEYFQMIVSVKSFTALIRRVRMKGIKELLEEFVSSQADYGEIAEVDADAAEVYDFIQGYILKEHLSISVLKVKNKIFLSRNKLEFDKLYELIKRLCHLSIEDKLMEIWEDKENKLLNVVFPSIKRHFLIRYVDEEDKLDKIEAILQEKAFIYSR